MTKEEELQELEELRKIPPEQLQQRLGKIADWIAATQAENLRMRDALKTAADHLEHCMRKLKAPDQYMVDEARDALAKSN